MLALATLTRQNGFLCVPVAAVAVWLVARAFGSPKPLRTALAFFLGNLCLLAVAGVLLSVVHANSSYDRGVRLLRTYDIVGVAAIDPHVNLSALDHGNPRVDAMIRREARTFPPQRVDDVALRAPRLWSFLLAQPGSAINAQWWSIVRHDFGYYLRDRLSVFSWTFLTPDITRCLPVFAGIDGNPAWLQSLGLREGERPQDAALVSYSERFFHTPLYSHAFYALIAIVLVFVLALRGDPTDIAVTAMLVSALLVAASYYVVSIACAFRLLYFLDVGAFAGLLYFSVDPRLPHSRRRSAAAHPPAAPRHAIPDQSTP